MVKTKQAFHYEKLTAGSITPIDVFSHLRGKKFLLESKTKHETKGKFSFLGMNPYSEVVGKETETSIKNFLTDEIKVENMHAIDYLKEHVTKYDLKIPVPFYGGAVGYVGYDAIRNVEDIGPALQDDLEMPDVHFMLFQDVIVFDHLNHDIYLIVIDVVNRTDENNFDERLSQLKKTIRESERTDESNHQSIQFQSEISESLFKEKVEEVKRYIAKGEVEQVVLSQRMTAEVSDNPYFPFNLYRTLRKVNPSPYMFYIDFADYQIFGASPESLVQSNGSEIITNPIAGTRPRGKTFTEDEALEKELLMDEKELSEHQMLVALSKGELLPICEPASIATPTYMQIERYQHVMHIVSEVRGELRKNLTSLDALLACLPAGTVSGSPKKRAMQIINELEEKKRGVYGGGIGYINFNGDLNIALAIRSLILKDHKAYIQAGAGIVAASDPTSEYQETLNKAKTLMEIL